MSPTNIFAPASTPADSIFGVSVFVILNVAAIFVQEVLTDETADEAGGVAEAKLARE